jgi:ubiquinone/menaquinone biosynthesis C-methylase UbiE/uncharacterized protein YbaR (Trm112 family)
MREQTAFIYRCPDSKERLVLSVERGEKSEILEGTLSSQSTRKYRIRNGIPYLVYPDQLLPSDAYVRVEYDKAASDYDTYTKFIFDSFFEDENTVRESLVDSLRLSEDAKVLEIGCGTGSDSVRIASRLGPQGELYLQDLSGEMLEVCRSKFSQSNTVPEFAVTNAAYLPFADGYFDVVYHFGGINTFSEPGRALSEMTRVTRMGGRVMVGDEGVPIWLKDKLLGKILIAANPLYENEPPLKFLPENARNVSVRWILGGAFYVIEYTVGEGPPPVNLDCAIPGKRGGTYRTRFYGRLEGVAPETKELVNRAVAKTGKSVHAWLDEVLRDVAEEQLRKTDKDG